MAPTIIKTVSSEDRLRRRPSKIFFCKICLVECGIKKGITLNKCRCVFCKECVQQYLTYAISDGNVLRIPCPDGTCSGRGDITETEISGLIGDDKFNRYLRLRKRKEVQIDKSKAFCPNPGCEGVCEGMPGTAQPCYCLECDHAFCFACKEPWHPNLTCKEYISSVSDATSGLKLIDIVKEGESTAEIKQCPTCQVLIQRDAGCAQMMCGNCKHIFCWHCRKSLDNDIMLRHYDKGPCRNKLGHSRSTLFLHRTQVVAGFVFFGAMIIVAAPFLLLISPCFLFSKCALRNEKTGN